MRAWRWTPKTDAAGDERRYLGRARAGDSRAFDRLLCEFEPALTGFVRRRVDPDAVDDVLQETRLAAWRALPGYEPNGHFKAWLYRIALHKTADWARQKSRSVTVELPPPDFSPTERAETRWLADAVLESLPETQRAVLELYYYEGLTLAEVATALERNLNTVKTQFYQAHARAAKLWSESGERSSTP